MRVPCRLSNIKSDSLTLAFIILVAEPIDLGLWGTNVHRSTTADNGVTTIDTIEIASSAAGIEDLGDAQIVVC